jgi:hypothetical protein
MKSHDNRREDAPGGETMKTWWIKVKIGFWLLIIAGIIVAGYYTMKSTIKGDSAPAPVVCGDYTSSNNVFYHNPASDTGQGITWQGEEWSGTAYASSAGSVEYQVEQFKADNEWLFGHAVSVRENDVPYCDGKPLESGTTISVYNEGKWIPKPVVVDSVISPVPTPNELNNALEAIKELQRKVKELEQAKDKP